MHCYSKWEFNWLWTLLPLPTSLPPIHVLEWGRTSRQRRTRQDRPMCRLSTFDFSWLRTFMCIRSTLFFVSDICQRRIAHSIPTLLLLLLLRLTTFVTLHTHTHTRILVYMHFFFLSIRILVLNRKIQLCTVHHISVFLFSPPSFFMLVKLVIAPNNPFPTVPQNRLTLNCTTICLGGVNNTE